MDGVGGVTGVSHDVHALCLLEVLPAASPCIYVSTDENRKEKLKIKLGSPNSKKRIPGIYIFTHLPTGKNYVGSSSELALRLNGYINLTHKRNGLLIPLLIKENLTSFCDSH